MKNFIIPSIDLLDGKVVRLFKGDYEKKTIYDIAISDLLEKYKDYKNLHIVDLNGAKGDLIKNISVVKEIRKNFKNKIQFGGGVRSLDIAGDLLDELKLDRVVLGTVAINNFNLTAQILEKFGKEKIVLALDCQRIGDNYFPKANGWLEETKEDLFTILEKYKNIAKYILCTDINVDGTMQGPNFDLYKKIKDKFPEFVLQASGGVSSVEDLKELQGIADFAIVGKMLYQ